MPIDLTSIPQLARNLNRVVEIATVLTKYGLADGFSRIDAGFLRRFVRHIPLHSLTELSQAERVRLAFTDLGTTFIKLGQMLSTRRDLVGGELAAELTQLQTNVPADPFETTRATVEAELKRPIKELFTRFDEVPVASASIGQAHRATLPDGREVIVKVQHPDIARRVQTDLVILAELARLVNPTFNLVEVLEPYRRQFLLRRLSPRRLARRLLAAARDWDEVVSGMPRLVRDVMQFARRQQFAVQLQHQHLEPSVNRLVFGLMTSALFVGSAWLWAHRAPPVVFGEISIFGAVGCLTSAVLGFRLFRAIQHSGRLEEDDR